MPIKALTLDFYGTLVDWLPVWTKGSSIILKENRLEVSPSVFALRWRALQREHANKKTFIPYKDNIRFALDQLCTEFHIKNKNYSESLFMNWHKIIPFPEVAPAFKSLENVTVGICSNSARDLFDVCIKKLPVKFDFILLSDDTKVNKPHAEMYNKAILSAGVPINQILHIASSQMDVKGATNAGLAVCWINRLHETREGHTPKPQFEINTFDELLSLID